jgi:hypothetical protein
LFVLRGLRSGSAPDDEVVFHLAPKEPCFGVGTAWPMAK